MIVKRMLPLLALVLSGAAAAAPDMAVEAVLMPAWVDRDGASLPAAVGMALKDRDVLRTGAGARLLLRAADGSTVKLGEQASLALEDVGQRQKKRDIFTATLEVARGAFRFATAAAARLAKREVSVRVGTATVGIRGTDVWGKSEDARDIVCLIEGSVEVTRASEAPVTLSEPLTFYVAPKDAPAQPVAKVDPKQLQIWAGETEIAPGRGAARQGGTWYVNLMALDDQPPVLAAYDELRANGYPAEILPVKKDERYFYRIRIGNLPGKAEADALGRSLKGRFGITDPWVSQ